jgi:uncharacterized protein YjbI with pentapeptide repeats
VSGPRLRDRRVLSGGNFSDCTIDGDFRNAIGYKAKWTKVLFLEANFANANLFGGEFEDCIFEKTTLDRVNFTGSTFRNTHFVECSLDQAIFDNSILRAVTIRGGRAEYASFNNASMNEVELDTQLHGADLRFGYTKDLSYGHSNLWGSSINVNCNNFVGKKINERGLKLFLALLSKTTGNPELTAKIRELVEPKYLTMIDKMAGEE